MAAKVGAVSDLMVFCCCCTLVGGWVLVKVSELFALSKCSSYQAYSAPRMPAITNTPINISMTRLHIVKSPSMSIKYN